LRYGRLRVNSIRLASQYTFRSGRAVSRHAPRPGRRVYGEAVREALILLWEASDRVCGKRLKVLLPVLIAAMERHGRLELDPVVRTAVTAMSAATIDRALAPCREASGGRRRWPSAGVPSIRRKSRRCSNGLSRLLVLLAHLGLRHAENAP
jgi:hypothetical protein